jgi:hypothetical protein
MLIIIRGMIGLLAIICSFIWMITTKTKTDYGKLTLFFYGLYIALMIIELI